MTIPATEWRTIWYKRRQKGNKTCAQYVKYLAKNGDKMMTNKLHI